MIKISDISLRPKLTLIILTILGFFLRLIASLNLDVFADDMLYASESAGIINAGLLSTHSNPPLFFYLTDLSYKVFGYSTFASRFWPLIAGTLLIPLVFYLTNILTKNNKLALASSFFVAISTFLIRMTFTEQSLLVLFFVVFAFICGLKYVNTGKVLWVYLFGVGFGLASLTKYSAPFFFISFALFIGYLYERKKTNLKGKINFKNVFMILGIIFIFSLPFLAFNLFIYKQSGIVDVYFSRIIHVDKAQQLYSGLAGQGESFFQRISNPDSYGQYKLPLITDPVLTLFAIFGFYIMFKKKESVVMSFVLIMLLIPFILQSGGSALQKHFAFMPLFLSIPAAYGLIGLKDKIKDKKMMISLISIIFISIILSWGTSYGTPDNLFKQSATSELKSFLNDKVESSDLIILDTRIYTAKNFWLATPNNFILSSQFPDVYNLSLQVPQNTLKPTKVFYVECVIEDCGWGWIQNDQALNQSTEYISNVFSSNGVLLKSINSPKRSAQEIIKGSEEQNVYKVYYITLNLPQELVSNVKNIQNFYFTPYLYANMNNYLFNYKVSGFSSFIENISLWTIYLAIILSFLIALTTIWLVFFDK
ncbi:MAG: ArnT family glycosyltransferase [Candidatus Pacearchaeota archaeon]